MVKNDSKRCQKNCLCGIKYTPVVKHKFTKISCAKITFYRIFLLVLFTLILTCFLLFVIVPLIFKFSYKLQSAAVFLNFVNVPPNTIYENPEKSGLDGARNFYLTTDDDVTLGIWQILPEELIDPTNTPKDDNFYENVLKNGQNVIIYNHGNTGSRATGYRVEIYKVLRKHFHVIAYDYRSYGDSSNVVPTEPDTVKDCTFLYKWVASKTTGHVFIWAHSLGSSIAIQSLALLHREDIRPTGIILEAPFNNLRDQIYEVPIAQIYKHLPWFYHTVVEPMQKNNLKFETDKHICNVDLPIIILHAEDDNVIPLKLGRKLYDAAINCRNKSQGSVTFHKFNRKYKYGHKYICRAPEIHRIIRNFVTEAIIQERINTKPHV